MTTLRLIGKFIGGLYALAGSFWALQGAGVIMWPSESFMLADSKWIIIGIAVALTGVLLILLSRRSGSGSQ